MFSIIDSCIGGLIQLRIRSELNQSPATDRECGWVFEGWAFFIRGPRGQKFFGLSHIEDKSQQQCLYARVLAKHIARDDSQVVELQPQMVHIAPALQRSARMTQEVEVLE